MDVTNQNLWNRIWAVATATCFLQLLRQILTMPVQDCACVLLQQNSRLVDQFASVGFEIFL